MKQEKGKFIAANYKATVLIFFHLVMVQLHAQQPAFSDLYAYIGNQSLFEVNQVEAHTVCIPYANNIDTLKGYRWQNENVFSLNGKWRFFFANTPDEAPTDFFISNFNDKKWSEITVPSNWEMQGFGDPLFRNVAQPFHAKPPYVPHEYNPAGSYRKTFTLPANWKSKHVFLRMEISRIIQSMQNLQQILEKHELI